jgi:hypothetical protein
MGREKDIGRCETCGEKFGYYLIHNGFNDTAYSYCDSCGMTSLVGGWGDTKVPKEARLKIHGVISESAEPFLKRCQCGGRFRRGASPRCPHCNAELSAVGATKYIEENAPGAREGWRWQQDWVGMYCIVIEDKLVENNWRES